MNFDRVTVDPKTSFIYFVYPFLFDTGEFEARVKAIDTAQLSGRDRTHKIWEPQQFSETDLLLHVANYLNAEINPTARFWRLSDVVRDTFGFRGGKTDWYLSTPQGKISFCFGEEQGKGNKVVELVLFKVGVGFVIVRSQPISDQVNDWLNFTHYFRFSSKRQNVKIKAEKRHRNQETQQTELCPFFPELAGGIQQHPDGSGELYEILKVLLNTALEPVPLFWQLKKFIPDFERRNLSLKPQLWLTFWKYNKLWLTLKLGNLSQKLLPQLCSNFLAIWESSPWWKEVFVPGQMLSFTALFVNNCSENDIPYLLYKLHNFFPIGELGDNPALGDLEIDRSTRICYGKEQWFNFSLEGSSFLAVDAPKTKFYQQNLPDHLRDRYFLLFLLALHQRFTLMMLSAKVADNWVIGEDAKIDAKRQKLFEEIRNQLLVFTARGYYTQAMQREQHHRCYQKWHEVFDLERLYQEVSDEVREMHEYSLMRQTRRLERTIQIIGVAAGTGGIVASSTSAYIKEPLKLNFSGKLDTIHPGVSALMLSLLLGVIAGGLTWLGTGGWNWLLTNIKQSFSKN